MASAAACYLHPTRLAVEHCEQCRRPVCGSCLWYAESGRRLCPDHAAERLQAGETVTPPERYAEGIVHSEVSAAQPAGRGLPYQGNGVDLSALVAGLTGAAALLMCTGQVWVLPFLAFGLGVAAWWQARGAANARRTRWLAGLGLAGGGVYLLFILAWVAFTTVCALTVFINVIAAGPRIVPIPTPFPVTPFTP